MTNSFSVVVSLDFWWYKFSNRPVMGPEETDWIMNLEETEDQKHNHLLSGLDF